MKLEIVKLFKDNATDELLTIKQPSFKRQWMDETRDDYAYRCLPLNIANQNGWAIYPKSQISFIWNGLNGREAIQLLEGSELVAASWFGYGIITFGMPFLIRLEKGYSLYITGAPNHHIKGVQPCTGIFEADWAPYTFTMNWRIMQPNYKVTFTPDDPLCFFFPIQRDLVEKTETVFSDYEDLDDYTKSMVVKFVEDREEFNSKSPLDWQKHYFQGKYPDGNKCPVDHKTKIKAQKFK